jgi:hypothetical protein
VFLNLAAPARAILMSFLAGFPHCSQVSSESGRFVKRKTYLSNQTNTLWATASINCTNVARATSDIAILRLGTRCQASANSILSTETNVLGLASVINCLLNSTEAETFGIVWVTIGESSTCLGITDLGRADSI